ncbi:MAG: tRNA pseudouridine(38-40) synthase TruA [Alphaproteobacteria bacterium]|nr:tRNA pseudouridine(38-40) synthase TruA [Alphaproteobacteria bacterium]
MTKRWKIVIEYNGTNYAGFQRQPDIATVQGEIETALKKFSNQNIEITVAGRTDSGVHAWGQVAHFDLDYKTASGLPRDITGYELAKAINAHLLPQPISIIDAEEVADDFHARFSAKQKTYCYRIINRPYRLGLNQNLAWWVKRPLNVEAMQDAAQILIGQHDFTTFRDSECQAKSPVRTLDSIHIDTTSITNGQEILFTVSGMSFLHHMVRNIVGTLSYVGEGKFTKQDVIDALEARDRTKGGPTAPADGLYLVSIDY